ncbi:hypothetical protein [Streptomyces brevispora]|uniref:Uncharacterized protein n=1 Tax=Streptomyces brevispora TaxID=887462 RepID=A0ABZ1G6G7_9ACTN|nr:hypothetical protein [Streptomyces brevispora]WSC14780.1 hypothetical protein OIE64_19370 [Streptomyces brevispora]
MLDPDEVLTLAESIKTEDLHQGIVLDTDGILLDGRNRLAACVRSGPEGRSHQPAEDSSATRRVP